MKRTSLIRLLLSVMLTSIVMFTVSVHEVHYLFVEHHQHDHCDNHLHAADDHADCSVCKFDISLFVESFTQFETPKPAFNTLETYIALPDVIVNKAFLTPSLRGPPVMA